MNALSTDLLPRPGRRSALPWLIAAAAFLMTLATACALALDRSGDAIEAASAGRITISIAEADPALREAAARQALAILATGTATAHAMRVDQAEIGRLTAPYLGAGADIPLPALIDADLRPGVTVDVVRTALRPVATVRVDAEGAALAPLLGLIAALQRLALTVLLISTLVAMLVTMLVARAALASHAATIETLHGLGATDLQLARLVERRTALDALTGATLGLVAAVGAILLVSAQFDALNGGDGMAPRLPPGEWAVLAFLPLILALGAMLATRLTILRQLRRSV